MNILITGGAGFIGSHLANVLVGDDDVTVIDDMTTGNPKNLNERVTLIEGSITNSGKLENAFARSKPDVVIHAAASYKDPEDWKRDALTNVVGTAMVCKMAKEYKVKRLIYFQTTLCYGLQPTEQPITINYPLKPEKSTYAITKTAGENIISMSGLDFISFRLANIFGPRNLSGPIPTFYSRLTAKKPCFVVDTRRDFVFIEDLVRVVKKAIYGQGSCGYYHISSGSDYSIEDVYQGVVKALDITLDGPIDIRAPGDDDADTLLLDPTKTNKDFDWLVEVPLAIGIQAAVNWYKENGVENTYTHLKMEE